MSKAKLRAVLAGAGKIGMGYANDPVRARHFSYATHAQALAAHPAFVWEGVVDPADEVLAMARNRWGVTMLAQSVEKIARTCEPDVLVLATPPDSRLAILQQLPTVRAVLVEKPLGLTVQDAHAFLEYCRCRGILVQVNLWRRADDIFRSLAAGRLRELIGPVQTAFGVYGNGLQNNGTHMVDFVRMLLGDVAAVQAIAGTPSFPGSPFPEDRNVAFSLRIGDRFAAMFHPVRFENYRENSLDIWGEKGRISITQEGLVTTLFPLRESRLLRDAREISSDSPQFVGSTVGHALYNLYGNLAHAVHGEEPLWSNGESALQTAGIVQAVLDSASRNGAVIEFASSPLCA